MHTDGPCPMYLQVYICIYDTHSTYSGSGISTVGVASLQWEWHVHSVCMFIKHYRQVYLIVIRSHLCVDVDWNAQCDRKSLSHCIRSHKCACNDKTDNYCQLGVCLVPTTTVSWVSAWSPLLLSVGCLLGPHYYCQLGVCLVSTHLPLN